MLLAFENDQKRGTGQQFEAEFCLWNCEWPRRIGQPTWLHLAQQAAFCGTVTRPRPFSMPLFHSCSSNNAAQEQGKISILALPYGGSAVQSTLGHIGLTLFFSKVS